MSQIDRALRIKEDAAGGAGVTVADIQTGHVAAQAGQATPLHQYPHEREDFGPDVSPVLKEDVADAVPPSRLRQATKRATRHQIATDLPARLVTTTESSVSVEQYRRLAAVLHEEQVQSRLKTVMITSALPGEGKTLTVANLALTLSESYARRVLVIDADLRLPTLHTTLQIANERGLSEALGGTQELELVEVSKRLTALTAGNPGPTPLAGLTSDRMREILLECEARFDWVLIDSSPVGLLPDAQVLGRLVGAILLVVRAGSTPSATVERAIAELGGPDSIFGIVLNRVEEGRIPQAGYYGQYGPADDEK